MAQPTPYDRQYSFASYQALHPSNPLPGDEVDSELNAVKASLDETQSNLALIQRDDGQLANGSVGIDQLSSEITVGLTPAIMWAPNINLTTNQSVFNNLILYRTIAACNTGSVFNAAQFVELADLSSIAAPIGTVGTANLVDGCVTNVKLAVGAVTPSKMTGFTGARLIGRYSATSGDIQTIAVGTGLVLDVSGNLTLDPSPTLTAPALGAATATSLAVSGAASVGAGLTVGASISDGIGNLRDIPALSQPSSYTLIASDNGKRIDAGSTVQLPASVMGNGNCGVIYNTTGGDISITSQVGVTTYLAGVGSTGTRTLAQKGVATWLCVGASVFVVSGAGLT